MGGRTIDLFGSEQESANAGASNTITPKIFETQVVEIAGEAEETKQPSPGSDIEVARETLFKDADVLHSEECYDSTEDKPKATKVLEVTKRKVKRAKGSKANPMMQKKT